MNASPKTLLIVGAVGVVGFLLWRARQAIGETLSTTLNPASDQNAAYTAVNTVGGALTGEGDGFSLGSYLYDLLNDTPDPTAPVTVAPRNNASAWNPYAPQGYRADYVTRDSGIGSGVLGFADQFAGILATLNPFGTATAGRTEYVTRNNDTAGIAQAPRVLPTY